ncbi:hypothetical protein [Pseudomonas sp. C9-3]|uniref:hypothetical protein n=1 Tax=Pseudomonas sp. C9-3 TaxID=3078264 RepID=UPI0028E360B1|nr:hypothetical protein [Pseudomonas sp. C9-3]
MAATTAVVAGTVAASAYAANQAKKGAEKQADAAESAAQGQQDAAAQMRTDLSPFVSLGTGSQNALLKAMGYNPTFKDGKLAELAVNSASPLQQKFSFNASNLESSPGYQFALQQGLKAGQNSMTSRGLGLSGAQLKGAQQFSTGLAQQTFNDQYNNALSTYNTNYQTAGNNVNNLMQLLQTGQASAAQTGTAGINAANSAGGYMVDAGNAQAAGRMGQANALSGLANTGLGLYALNKKYG